MRCGIAVDRWKLHIFERHLSQAGYAYKNNGSLIQDVLLLTVETPNAEALAEVLKAAIAEAANLGTKQ